MAEATEGGGLVFHPLDQFIVHPFFGEPGDPVHWWTFTNATMWMMIAVGAIWALFWLGTARQAAVPGRGQSLAELTYGFIRKMVEDIAGHDALRYFPLVFTLFLFVVFTNYLGLVPTSFTATAHIAVSAVLGFGVFLGVTILGFALHGRRFLGLFWMTDAPLFLRPIIAVIEVISYLVRPVSHSIRLAGNIMAGHTVLKVFAGFAQVALISPLAIFGVVAIYGLEILVAGIQAYVFTILTCVYLKDALHPGH